MKYETYEIPDYDYIISSAFRHPETENVFTPLTCTFELEYLTRMIRDYGEKEALKEIRKEFDRSLAQAVVEAEYKFKK